ncbi:hypothetical protein [Lutibacter maritimus]|uniref:Uncharacterized protein n=1 Tax=Lutibacter maritimus TaxID=593133 RepID=A0A1I6NP73_9FLAO|nr:hypothetical protein [Lutibacter maritimus]SFS29683.1 hypothetical protein SAMN04488006_0235 [Lutibacter maritimus]
MKNKKRLSLIASSLIAIIIITIPYLLYFHKSIDPDIENLETIFGTIRGGHYKFAQSFIYFLFAKLVPLILLFIWFITNKHWWVHALIIPITVYLFQLIGIFNDSLKYVDEVEFIYTVPIAAVIMGLLYFVRSKISIYIQAVDLKKEMDDNMKIPKKFK